METRSEEAQVKLPFFCGLRRPLLKHTGFPFSPLAEKGQNHLLERSRVWQRQETPGAHFLGNKKIKQTNKQNKKNLLSPP